ncbi:MAG: 50S ribosomal protein L4 [bacterium]|nr:50S ribosomal protein L4 [bacterium]
MQNKVEKPVRKVSVKKKTTDRKKETAVRASKPSTRPPATSGLQVKLLDTNGNDSGTIELPKKLFDASYGDAVLAQAVRVYLGNQREGGASTKTRGEVEGSTRKIYRQKGTGKARHGAVRAPIFVGGGIVFGPKPRSYHLSLPDSMRHAALSSALTSQRKKGNVIIVDGLSALQPKTRVFAGALLAMGVPKGALIIAAPKSHTVIRGARNIEGISILPASDINPYAVLRATKLVVMKEAVSVLAQTFIH